MSVQESYDKWSDKYDSDKNHTRDLDKEITESVLGFYSFNSTLEIGCGTGKNTTFLSSISTNVHATDFSHGMLSQAKKNVAAENVKFSNSDITSQWTTGYNQYDLVTCNLVLEHIKDLGHVFLEAYKSLVPEGLLFISELHPFKQYSGTQARFGKIGEEQEITAHVHDVSDYLLFAELNGFELRKLQEWRYDPEKEVIPRILSLLFRKMPNKSRKRDAVTD